MRNGAKVTLLLVCDGKTQPDGCSVYFEPEGAEHLLLPGDSFQVECTPPEGAEIELMYFGDGGIAVHAGYAWGVRAFRRDGSELKL